MKVPFVDLGSQQSEIADEVRLGLDSVFERTAFVGGPEVTAFEEAYASFVGAGHCVGVGNGTDALELAMRAVGVRPGGEVIVPANTFIATAEAVSRIGALPVPVDVDESQLLIDPVAVERAITPRTQAIVPVHLFGQTAFVEQVLPLAEAAGIPVIEDAAQSQGAQRNGRGSGSLAAAAATSFYPGKNLGAAGDAGAVMTSDPEIARTVRLLAAHGSETKYVHEVVGMNSRLDTVQAVVLSAKLARLEKWNELRRQAADRYHVLLDGVRGVRLPESAPGNLDVWHLYVVRVRDRDRVLAALLEAGVGTGIHYPFPVHLTAAYASLGFGEGSFPVAERAAGEILSLPMFPHLSPEQQEYVAEVLAAAVGHG
ncbi:DegT/DnrJ/EryC1/StrS family aminotransferase [Nocardioides sp. NPDC006273]|uniref:DegT/DnrJ/EryC1/StrS family aminotransferase n=1 Tax=Nocardioides sp. NPDC006273 TaxID=3155598 RepID=UPI0033AAC1C9